MYDSVNRIVVVGFDYKSTYNECNNKQNNYYADNIYQPSAGDAHNFLVVKFFRQ